MNVALITTCHPRIEINYIAEWLEYYIALGFDLIDIYIDVGYHNTPHYRIEKPLYDYHDELTDHEAISKFREIVASFGIQCKEGVATGGWGERQTENILRTLGGEAFHCDYLLHLDVDEFLVLKGEGKSSIQNKLGVLCREFGERHFGFYQTLMAPRWSEKSVWDIRLTKGNMDGSWKSAVNVGKIGPQYNEGPCFEQRYKTIHGQIRPRFEIPTSHAEIFHFVGWELNLEGLPPGRQDRLIKKIRKWQSYLQFEITEHTMYRNFLRLGV